MSTVQRTSGYNYQDYVPVEGITCPICDIACTSLQALNLHLDEAHTEEDSKGALLSWFRNAQKKVQTTLASNARSPMGSSSSSYSAERSLKQLVDPVFMSSFQNLTLNGVGGPAFFASDSEGDFITRSHWQAESGNDVCSLPGCGKPLGRIGAARQHCRQCGKIFCEAHMQYEIKLDRHARHDPVNGVWCRVCFGCFVSRPDYMSVSGVTRSWTDTFLKKRAKTIDRVHLESNRLERRLEKLARIHHSTDIGSSRDTPRSGSSSSLGALSLERTDSTSSKDSGSVMSSKSARVSNGNSILSMKLKYRDGEQTVTKWQDDKNVTNCPLCSTKFTLTNRKHHCRLCGRVVCGQSRCSRMIPLFLDMSSNQFDEEPVGDTRACAECQRSVFRRKTMHEEASKPLPIIQLYQQLSITRQNIEKQLPLFHDMIVLLEKDKISRQSQANIQKAAQIRKSLLDSFALYDTLAKTIKSLPVRSPSVRRLQGNICTAANLYLQQNMLPLQMLPRILKPEKKKQLNGASSKPQKEDLRLQLEAFQEQEMLLQGYIQDAQRNRKYDDVKTLQRSLEEVRVEIERIKANLA